MAEEQTKDPFANFEPVSDAVTTGEDEFAGFDQPASEATSDVSAKLRALGQGATGAAVETTGFVAGAASGFALTAPIPIPGARVVGTLVGGGLGLLAGGEARKGLSEVDIPGTDTPFTRPGTMSFPPEERPFAVAGEVLGGGAPFSGATVTLAKRGFQFGKSFIGSFLNRILSSAKNSPGTFLAAETAGLTGAAAGGGIAEFADPGAKGTRFGAEVVGGFFNPTRLLVKAGDVTAATVRRAVQAMSPQARQSKAALILQELVEDAGDDPVLLARMLEQSGLPGVGAQTAAQKTGVEALAELQAQLVTINGKFSAEAKALTEANLNNIDVMIRALRSTGDPGALREIANLESQKFKLLIGGRLQAAEREVNNSVAKITKDTPEARIEISEQATKVLTEARDVARTAESKLWDQIDTKLRVKIDDVLEEHQILSKDLLPDEKLPSVIENFIKRHTTESADGTVSMGELITLRKRSLALAREAQAAGKFSDARAFGHIAESVLDSMDTTFGGPGAGLNRFLGVSGDAYHTARAFSREFNQTFTNTFAGQALAKGPKGSSRVPAELMMSRALATGKDAGAMRLRELEEATRFMSVKGIADTQEAEQAMGLMLDAQERLLRLAASESVDPNTGRVSAKQLGSFIRNNAVLMKRFPEIKKDLERAVASEIELQKIIRTGKNATRIVDQQAAFSKVAKLENSVQAVKGAVQGRNPERDLGALVKLANKGGFQAQQGLRSSILDNAIDEASKLSGRLNYKQLRASLFEPIEAGGKQSVIDIIRKTGIFSDDDVKRLTRLLDEADKIERVAATSGRADEGFLGEVDALSDLLTRGLGSTLATRAGKLFGSSGAGPSLIIAGAGSRAAQRALSRVPQARIRDILIEAATVPEFMAMLLRKPKTPKGKLELNRQLHAYLIQAGFTAAEGTDEEDLQLPAGP